MTLLWFAALSWGRSLLLGSISSPSSFIFNDIRNLDRRTEAWLERYHLLQQEDFDIYLYFTLLCFFLFLFKLFQASLLAAYNEQYETLTWIYIPSVYVSRQAKWRSVDLPRRGKTDSPKIIEWRNCNHTTFEAGLFHHTSWSNFVGSSSQKQGTASKVSIQHYYI